MGAVMWIFVYFVVNMNELLNKSEVAGYNKRIEACIMPLDCTINLHPHVWVYRAFVQHAWLDTTKVF